MLMRRSRSSSFSNDETTPLLSRRPDNEAGSCSPAGWLSEPLRLPINGSPLVYESWTITMPSATAASSSGRGATGRGDRGLAVTPNTHFDQEELEMIYQNVRGKYQQRKLWKHVLNYDDDLQRRLARLDHDVQLEIYGLLKKRSAKTSNDFRKRDWKLIALAEIPGGEMTATAARNRTPVFRWPRSQALTEYHVLLRGCEVKRTERGWPFYNRDTRPWQMLDEEELAPAGRIAGS